MIEALSNVSPLGSIQRSKIPAKASDFPSVSD